jgi:hypothetical protein
VANIRLSPGRITAPGIAFESTRRGVSIAGDDGRMLPITGSRDCSTATDVMPDCHR